MAGPAAWHLRSGAGGGRQNQPGRFVLAKYYAVPAGLGIDHAWYAVSETQLLAFRFAHRHHHPVCRLDSRPAAIRDLLRAPGTEPGHGAMDAAFHRRAAVVDTGFVDRR